MDIQDENVKVMVFLREGNARLLATATVSVRTVDYGFMTIKGFQIWKSKNLNGRLQEFMNITPPSTMIKGSRYFVIFFENKELWSNLEEAIYSSYRLAAVKKIKESKKETSYTSEELVDEVDAGLNDSNSSYKGE